LKIPPNSRKLITDALTVLLTRIGVGGEKIAAITGAIEEKEGNQMFDRLVAGPLEEREQTRGETQAEAYNEKLESARKMKARGYSNEDIADILSLAAKDVEAL
jgi:SOS response regulatory protein OraA/RecX